jgi:hypothetical protein
MQLRQAKTPAGAAYLIKNAAAGGVQPLFIILYYLLFLGNTAQFPPDGLSTAPAAAARHLRCQNAR